MLIRVTHVMIPLELVIAFELVYDSDDTVGSDASEDKLQVCVTMTEEISL